MSFNVWSIGTAGRDAGDGFRDVKRGRPTRQLPVRQRLMHLSRPNARDRFQSDKASSSRTMTQFAPAQPSAGLGWSMVTRNSAIFTP